MVDFLYGIDKALFYFINVTLANPVTDYLMPFITDLDHWKLFFLIMWLNLIIAGGKKGRIVAFLAIILVTFTDQLSSNLIKQTVERIRPCNVLDGIHLLVDRTSSFSFPSSHAVNYFGGAYFFSHFYPNYRIAFYIGASLAALSRVFCGVHYPSDIVGGAIIGTLAAMLLVYIWELINTKFNILKESR